MLPLPSSTVIFLNLISNLIATFMFCLLMFICSWESQTYPLASDPLSMSEELQNPDALYSTLLDEIAVSQADGQPPSRGKTCIHKRCEAGTTSKRK